MTYKADNIRTELGKTICRSTAAIASTLGSLALVACMIAAPVTLDSENGGIVIKAAVAKGGNGGGSGGNGGGGGGNGGGGGGNGANGSSGNSSAGGPNGQGPNPNAQLSDDDNGKDILPLSIEPTITIAQFTTKITKRYPADEITTHYNPHQSISFYCELRNMKGEQITHRWFYDGQLQYEANFKIRANLWRVWSTHLLPEDKPGVWKVEIQNSDGEVLAVHSLNFQPSGPAIAAN